MAFNKKFFTTGGIVASSPTAAEFDPLQNFETVTYTGNGGTQKITGYIRKGAAFNGSSSKIFLTSTGTSITDYDSDFSISMWVYMVNLPHAVSQDHLWTGGGTRIIPMSINTDGTVSINFYNGGSNLLYSTTSLTQNGWTHLVMTRSKTNGLKFYLDGSESGTSSYTGNAASLSQKDSIGSYWDGTRMSFDGKIDQVRIFNKALDQDDVDDLYLETYSDPKKSTTDYFEDGSAIALYELDEDANDTGRYGRGSIDTGYSFLFNGSSYINPASDPIPSTGAFTVSAWVKTSVSNHCFISFGDFWLKSEYISGVFSLGDLNTNLQGTTDISDGDWHHCALTVDASNNIVLYVDGVIEDTGTKTISRTNGGSFAIGVARLSNPVYYFSGNVDQVKIYSSALSASDIRELISETNAPTANLVAHYKLDGNVVDETTNHDGTWYGVNAYGSPAEFTTYDGTPTNVNFLGMAFQPDLVWLKNRFDINNLALFDSIRGREMLTTNTTNQGFTPPSGYDFTSFDSNGFTVAGSPYYININDLNDSMVAWCWKAGGTAVSNTDGTITSQVSANTDAGFSIVKYTGTFTSSTVGHGLSSTPEMIIVKNTDAATNWWVWTKDIGGADKYLKLNGTDFVNTATSIWNNTLPTSTVFSVANDGGSNGSGNEIIAYCFHSVDGYQKIGSYTGNGSATGPTVTTGFEPRFLLLKRADGTAGNWFIFDSARSTANERDDFLHPNSNAAETTNSAAYSVDFLSIGFQIKGNGDQINGNNGTYIYLAIA